MLAQKNNAVNPSRDLFVLNKSVNKIRAFNSAIPSDFSTVSKLDAARIKKEALELVNLVSYALNQRALKIDVIDDEKRQIVKTKHVSVIYYALNLIASQLETTARGIAEKLETEPTTTTEPEKETTETTEPAETVETIPTRFAAVNPYSGAPDLIKTVFLYDCKKTIRAYKIAPAAAETLEKFAVEFETVLKCRSKFVEKALEIRDKFAAWLEKENIFSVELDDREALFRLTRLDGLENATKDSRSASIRQDVKKLVDEIRDGLTGKKNWKWLNPWIETEKYPTEPKQEEKPAPVATVEPETEAPAPVVVVSADDRDDVMKMKEYLTKYDFKKSDAVPSMLLDSINKGCPLWSFKWFGFAELPRRYFNGACFSVNNMILLAFHGGYYVSLTEARRILGDKATPKEGAIARAVLRPVFKGAKNLRKSDLDALRNCEPIDDDTRQRHPDFYMVERVYDQTAFNGLELKKEKELPQNENERNAQAENIFRAFCKANNIGFLETEGNGQAVTQIKTNGLGKVESITINMPSISQFKSATAYYSVLFHEATHAANAVNGCQLTKKREELSAEIGSCIVLNTLGFDPAEYIDDSAHYVQRFKDCANEKNAIKKAWKYAQASALLILDSFINEPEPETSAPVEKQETAPAPVATVEPETETPATVEPDDDDNARKEAVKELLEALDSFNAAIAYAATTGGIVHIQKAEEIKKEVASLIKTADDLGALDSKTLARFETLCKNIAIVAIKNNLARLVDDTSRNWDQYQRAVLQTLREIETSETVQKNEKLQWRFTDAFNSVVESETSDDVKMILKNLVNAI